jgi:hypothetical protein
VSAWRSAQRVLFCSAWYRASRYSERTLELLPFVSHHLLQPDADFNSSATVSALVYINGNNVCRHGHPFNNVSEVISKGVVPFIYLFTFFQSLLTAAGYDPVAGPGSSCNTGQRAGQCVIPWGSGTKAVSSVVLIANSICFAVRLPSLALHPVYTDKLTVDHDVNIHFYQRSVRLRQPRTLATDHCYRHRLGLTICLHDIDQCVPHHTSSVSFDLRYDDEFDYLQALHAGRWLSFSIS